MAKSMSDKEAMNDIAQWMIDIDPTLTDDLPGWVWSLVSMVDDKLNNTGRKVYAIENLDDGS